MKQIQNLWILFVLFSGFVLTGCEETSARVDQGNGSLEPTTVKSEKETASEAVTSESAAQKAPEIVEAKEGMSKGTSEESKELVSGPKLEILNPVHDFGSIGPGSSHVCNYKIKNVGTELLKIERVQSTCGCSVPKLDKKEYKPGEEGTIEVRFKASTVKSSVSKHLYIHSNDAGNPRVELTLKAEVQVEVEIEPASVTLALNKKNSGMVPLKIYSTDGKKFAITSFETGNDVMSAQIDSSQRASSFEILPVVDPNALNKFMTGVIKIKVDHPKAGDLIVRYKTQERYRVSRPRIIIQNAIPGRKEVKDVWITSNYGDSLEIESTVSRAGTMELKSHKVVDNSLRCKVQINIPPRAESKKRYFSDDLTIILKSGYKVKISSNGWYRN